MKPDPIIFAGGINLCVYTQNDPVDFLDPYGLYRDIGGGLGITLAIVSVSYSVSTNTCCDDSGNKHLRTIQTVTLGLELGLGLKGSGGANASISDNKKAKKCPKMFDTTGFIPMILAFGGH